MNKSAAKDVEAQRKMQVADQLRRVAASLQDLANLLSEGKGTPMVEKTVQAEKLKEDLGANLQHVDVIQGPNDIQIRPKGFLGAEVFRSIADIVRKQRGRWDSGRRCFIIPLQ